MKEYKSIKVFPNTHKRFSESVGYGNTMDKKLNELLDNEKTNKKNNRNKQEDNRGLASQM